jgi:hypothetical protein
MLNLAVLIQLIGLVLTFTIGTAGYVAGPALILIGALIYRKENQRRNLESGGAPGGSPPSPPQARRGWMIAAAAMCIVPACAALIFVMTAGIVDTADGFFKAIADQDLPRAKTYLSVEFAAASTPDQLKAFLDRSALSRFKSSSWNSRKIENSRGELIGKITTTDGGNIPVTIGLVKEKGAWKIYSIQKPDAGVLSGKPHEISL